MRFPNQRLLSNLHTSASVRLGHNASISSKKITQGLESLALENTDLIALSDSPKYIFNNSGPFTEMKLIPDSFAIAFANNVLPQPL